MIFSSRDWQQFGMVVLEQIGAGTCARTASWTTPASTAASGSGTLTASDPPLLGGHLVQFTSNELRKKNASSAGGKRNHAHTGSKLHK